MESRTELDSLRQRQFTAVIDRGSLAAHVGLPGITPALTAAAGFLLAAEGAADFRAARADVHIRDTAITATRGQKQLRFTNVVGKNRRTEPLRNFVVILDGV